MLNDCFDCKTDEKLSDIERILEKKAERFIDDNTFFMIVPIDGEESHIATLYLVGKNIKSTLRRPPLVEVECTNGYKEILEKAFPELLPYFEYI